MRNRTPDGKRGEIDGVTAEGGRRIRGYFVEPGQDPLQRRSNKFDARLNADGKSFRATVTKGGAEADPWEGKMPVWRPTKGGTKFKFHNKEVFDRLCAPKARPPEWYEEEGKKALEASLSVKRVLVNGALSEAVPMSIGDPYRDPPKVDPRLVGRNIVTAVTKKGQVGEGCFFIQETPNCVGDQYADAKARVARRKAEIAKLKLPDRPQWKPAGEKVVRDDKYLLEVTAETPEDELKRLAKAQKEARGRRKGDVETQPRPIYTEPTMGGPPSAWGTLLLHRTEEGRKILTYHHDDYDNPIKEHKKWLKKEKEILGDRRPFTAHVAHGKTFSKDTEVYRDLGPGDGRPVEMRGKPSIGDKPPFKPADAISRDCAPRAPFMSDPIVEHKFKRGDYDSTAVRWKPGAVGTGTPLNASSTFARRNVIAMVRETYPKFREQEVKKRGLGLGPPPKRVIPGTPMDGR